MLNSNLSVKKQIVGNNLIIKQYGNIVVVNGYINNLSISSDGLIIGKLDDVISKPNENVRAVCNVGSNAYSVGSQGYFTIQSDGKIYVACGSETATIFYVSCSYIVD